MAEKSPSGAGRNQPKTSIVGHKMAQYGSAKKDSKQGSDTVRADVETEFRTGSGECSNSLALIAGRGLLENGKEQRIPDLDHCEPRRA
jgi:hypothetical protein